MVGGAAVGSAYGSSTATTAITINANFDIAATLTPAQLATIKVALNGTADEKLRNITSAGVTFTGLPTFPVTGAVSVPAMTTSGFTTGAGKTIDLALDPGATAGVTYIGFVTVTVNCGSTATVSAVPASNPWTLAALGGVLAIAGGGAAAARRRKAQNPSA